MNYGENPYVEYDGPANTQPRLYKGEVDSRLPATARVINIFGTNKNKIYPLNIIQKEGVINDTHENEKIVLFHQSGLVSVLDQADISKSKDIGAVGVFSPIVDSKLLTFKKTEKGFQDIETNSIWTITGKCIEGKLTGSQLEKIIHGNHFAFAWFEFNPDCIIYGQ
ncbi:MAG: DUF3179 domain-containing protein [Flavobacteriales bacterium]|nr:DUF3179 domain-containing protein [Flavobacteriales bacterium]